MPQLSNFNWVLIALYGITFFFMILLVFLNCSLFFSLSTETYKNLLFFDMFFF